MHNISGGLAFQGAAPRLAQKRYQLTSKQLKEGHEIAIGNQLLKSLST
jgi:hypothetical protein